MKTYKLKIALLVLFTAMIALVLPAQAQSTAAIVVSGAPTEAIQIDDTFTLTVEVQAGSNTVNGAEIHFEFDPALLNVTSVTAGSAFPVLIVGPNFDNTAGTIDFAGGQFSGSQTGAFTLLTIAFEAVGEGVATLAQGNLPSKVTTTAGVNILASGGVTFPPDITIGEDDPLEPGTVLFRVNAGGGNVAALDSGPAWSEDSDINPSPYLSNAGSSNEAGFGVTPGATVPAYVPAVIFSTERWDGPSDAAGEMLWSFPIPQPGDYTVNLFMGNGFGGTSQPGQRIFDVLIEGGAAFSDIDLSDEFGHLTGGLKTTTVNVTDGFLEIEFIHQLENPLVNAIEIIAAGDVPDNAAPVVTNPGTQNSAEGDVISLQIQATAPEQGQSLSYAATGLPPSLSINPNTGLISGTVDEEIPGSADGAFIEQNGVVVIEMESADTLPNNWETIDTYSTSFSPNVTSPGSAAGGDFIVWQAGQNLSNPGVGLITYQVQINNPGTYYFKWRSQVGNGTSSTDHNDTWLKIEADAFYGQQGSSIVCPKGFVPAENDCAATTTTEGAGSGGWFKIFSSGSTNWTWSTNTSDNSGHQIYARFDAPGVYNILVSARSSSHLLDRMVLNNASITSLNDTQRLSEAESQRSSGNGGTPGAADGSPYNVTVSVTDNGTPNLTTDVNFVWNVTEEPSNPSALVQVNPGGGLAASTFGNNSFQISNTGDVNITNITINTTTTFMPDVVFDPVGTAGDNAAKCLTANSSTQAIAVGITVPANGGTDAADCASVFAQPHNGVNNDEGYDILTLNFTDFDPGEAFAFGVDMDPTTIKGDLTSGDAGSVSGFELIGASVTITFEDGTVITASLFDEGSLGGSEAVVALGAPTPAPTIEIVGLNTPTVTSVQNQNVLITGPANQAFTLLQVDARLHIDPGNPAVGYDIDPFEANEAMAKVLHTGTIGANGTATVPVTLLLSQGSASTPDGGLNHFIAVIEGTGDQNSQTSNSIVVEYDPNANPTLVIDPASFNFTVDPGGETASQDYTVDTSDDSQMPTPAAMSIVDGNGQPVEWASTTSAANQDTPYGLTIDPTNLTTGTYTAFLVAGPVTGYEDGQATITVNVTGNQTASALVQVNQGTTDSGLTTSTFGSSSFQISNTGETAIVRVSIDLSSAFLPDVVFDPVGTAGDAGSQCLSVSAGAAATGLTVPGNGGSGTDPDCTVFEQFHNGVDLAEGYDIMTLNFTSFETGDSLSFGVDIDPTSIKGDSNSGDAGAISGFELIGSEIEIEFADGRILTATLFSASSSGASSGSSQAIIAETAPQPVPTIAMQGVNAPAVVSNPNQTITITGGPANATVALIRAEARLYVDDPDPVTGTGYDIDPFEANQALNRQVIAVTLDASGNATVPVTLTRTAPAIGPEGGLNHFIASVIGAAGEATLTTNSFVVEFDPNAGTPGALVQVTSGSTDATLSSSTFDTPIIITNTGLVDIETVRIDISSAFLPDVVFDPVGTAGDALAKCLAVSSGAAATGLTVDGNGGTGSDPDCLVFEQFHNGVDVEEGYDILFLEFDDFNPTESLSFTVDVDPTSIKDATGTGNAGAVSGFELIGGLVTVEFADGSTLTANLFSEVTATTPVGTAGGSEAVLAGDGPAAPTIAMQGVSAPAVVSNANQTINITGPANGTVALLRVDARLFITGSSGYDIDPFEANQAINREVIAVTLDSSGNASVPVTLTRTAPATGPVGGLNHFIAGVIDANGQVTTSNAIVVEYDPDAAADATLVGSFNLQGLSPDTADLTVTLYQNDTQVGQQVVSGVSGIFTLSGLTPGAYEIAVKHSNHLQSVETVTLIAGENPVDFGTMAAGDVNNDNIVNALDFSTLSSAFNTNASSPNFDARADLNGDGLVTALDFSLLSGNFNTGGETVINGN